MSHFTVFVITKKDPEELLAPYDENIELSEYQTNRVSKKELIGFVDYYKNREPKELSFDELYAKYGKEWNHNLWKKIGGQWFNYSTYNKKSKWDWYELGGRWDGKIVTKLGENVSEALLDDIDFRKTELPFAIVTPDGEWHEQGKMGWWAMVSDENKDWDKVAKKIIKTCLPDDFVYLYDLHI